MKIEAKNQLEDHCATVRKTFTEEKLQFKFDAGHTENTEEAAQDAFGLV